MIIVEFSIVPLGTCSTSMSDYVTMAYNEVEKTGVRCLLTPMGTIIETDTIEKAFEVIKRAHEAVLRAGAKRVSTSIRIDDRRDKERKMEDKVKAVKVIRTKKKLRLNLRMKHLRLIPSTNHFSSYEG